MADLLGEGVVGFLFPLQIFPEKRGEEKDNEDSNPFA